MCAFRLFQLLYQQRSKRADILFIQGEDVRAARIGFAIGKLLHFQHARLSSKARQGLASWLIVDEEQNLRRVSLLLLALQ